MRSDERGEFVIDLRTVEVPQEPDATDARTTWFEENAVTFPAELTLHIDGLRYMNRWVTNFQAVGTDGTVIHSAWRLTNVRLGPQGDPDVSFHALLKRGKTPKIFIRMSGHALSLTNLTELLRLRYLTAWRQVPVFPYLDQSYASSLGSFHQKSTCFYSSERGVTVMLGSVDLTSRRKDGPEHTRDSAATKRPTHDVGIEIRGPAAAQLMLTEIEMWSAASYFRDRVLWPFRTSKLQSPTDFAQQVRTAKRAAEQRPPSQDRVQLLRTIPRPTRERSWPYATYTERTLIEAYLAAIAKANSYIYIEDQYFTPNFGDAASGSWSWFDRKTPMDELIKALGRGVQLLVVVPGTSPNGPGIRQMRDRAVEGLRRQALSADVQPPVFAQLRGQPQGTLAKRSRRRSRDAAGPPVHVHSKLVVCDDEFAIVGSANLNGRSFVNDVELGVAVQGPFAAKLRRELWTEHTGVDHAEWRSQADILRAVVADGTGRLQRYDPEPGVTPPGKYLRWFWRLSEPKNE